MARQRVDDSAVITDARLSRTEDIDRRTRRYVISMTIRTACFIAMYFAPGIWRWVCLAGAAFIPGIAVVLANARDNRTPPADLKVHEPEPVNALELTSGHVIKGELHEDHPASA